MSLWTLAQEWDAEMPPPPPPFGSSLFDWFVVAFMLFAMVAITYMLLIRAPRAVAEQRRNSARVVELLESIDRRLAERDKA